MARGPSPVTRIAERAQQARDRARRLVKLNVELLQLEAKRKAKYYGIALALAIVALVLVLYAVGFVFAAIATGIAEALPLWASLLIVALLLAGTAALLALVAVRLVRKAGPPTPEATVAEIRATATELGDV